MKITSSLFHAHVKCPTKCWLRFTGDPATGNAYAEWAQGQNESYRDAAIKRLRSEGPQDECAVAPAQEDLQTSKWRLGFDVVATFQNLETRVHAVERVPSEGRGKPAQFIPTRFVFTNKLGKDEKLLLAFDAFVLSEILGRGIGLGKIIHGDDHSTLKVKTSSLAGEVRKRLDKVATLLSSPAPPDLVLNRHCVECEFQSRCRKIAIEKDDLSLLSTMSEKERQKLRAKGIFTVTQLSYTFRPRRRPKRLHDKREKYHHALKALAIREKKIHIVGTPELKIEGTPVYLDVEGLPDRDFYYLIGVRIGNGESAAQHSLWADSVEDEGKIWREFLGILETVERPVLIHYGSYETTFLKRMCERFGKPSKALTSLVNPIEQRVNVLSFLFGQIYFPCFSNGLKDIGAIAGAKWHSQNPSGIQSLVWRYNWEVTRSNDLKRALVAYNEDDCGALCLLTSELKQIGKEAMSRPDVDFAYAPKQNATIQGREIHGILERILVSAHVTYQRSRIHIRKKQHDQPQIAPRRKRKSPIHSRNLPANRGNIVRVRQKRNCPIHPAQQLEPVDKPTVHTMLDLVFTKNGCKKVFTTSVGHRAYCPLCNFAYLPPAINKLHQQIFGHAFMSWVTYQRVVLRLPFGVISTAMHELFSEYLNSSTASSLIYRMAAHYNSTEKLLWQKVLGSPILHVDETSISIRGNKQYIWVLTNGQHVVFRLTPTRETTFLQELLAGYEGTLISDFYAGYDALPCKQQKCLVHLIRDLNDDLWKNPFNTEFESFVTSVRDLLVPILHDVEKFGLKARHLRKQKSNVERFYEQTIHGSLPQSDLTAQYHKRFVRYQGSIFTFLDENGTPWHNNVAEWAIRHLAVQRKISGYFYSKGAQEYLRLLGIAQSCRLQGKSFLRFLISGCAEVDSFRKTRQRNAEEYLAPLT
jgi:predicted RecB family nuclease